MLAQGLDPTALWATCERAFGISVQGAEDGLCGEVGLRSACRGPRDDRGPFRHPPLCPGKDGAVGAREGRTDSSAFAAPAGGPRTSQNDAPLGVGTEASVSLDAGPLSSPPSTRVAGEAERHDAMQNGCSLLTGLQGGLGLRVSGETVKLCGENERGGGSRSSAAFLALRLQQPLSFRSIGLA